MDLFRSSPYFRQSLKFIEGELRKHWKRYRPLEQSQIAVVSNKKVPIAKRLLEMNAQLNSRVSQYNRILFI